MTLKPPTRTLPKLVMKEWPEKPIWSFASIGPIIGGTVFAYNHKTGKLYTDKALSDFTRVVEEMGVLDQEETPLRKRESKHD